MRLPTESSSSWSHLGFAVFCWSSLKAWAEARDLSESDRALLGELAVTLKAAIDELLREARETEDAAYFSRPLAMAQRNVKLYLLKRRLQSTLNRVIDAVALGSKDHPAVRQFLPRLLATVTGAKLTERPGLTRTAADNLAKGTGELPERAALVEGLLAIAGEAELAIKGAADALSGWGKERSEELLAKAKLRLELERVHRSLGAHFPGQHSFVESFFLAKGSKPSEGEDAAVEGESPAEGEPTV